MIGFIKGNINSFSYNVQIACDKNGWIVDYVIDTENIHDTQLLPGIFGKICKYSPQYIIVDYSLKPLTHTLLIIPSMYLYMAKRQSWYAKALKFHL